MATVTHASGAVPARKGPAAAATGPAGGPATPRGAATRDRVVRATADLLAREGYAATTWRRVAARAGVTGGVLQHHFGDRRSLLQAVLEQLADDALAHLESADLPTGGSVEDRVAAFVDALADHVTRDRELTFLHLTLGLGADGEGVPARTLLAMHERQAARWERLLPDVDPARARTAFRLLHAVLQGAAVQRVLVGDAGSADLRAAAVRALAATLEDRPA